ncbi:MAG TPA: response regulator [Polyangia bacterium]
MLRVSCLVGDDPRPEILLVEDDPDTADCMRDVFALHGFRLRTATNGHEALELLDGFDPPPCCIVLDLQMPVMNGWELMARLRGRRGVPPVLVVSGAADPPAGAIGYFPKPPPFDALLRAVRGCCRAR